MVNDFLGAWYRNVPTPFNPAQPAARIYDALRGGGDGGDATASDGGLSDELLAQLGDPTQEVDPELLSSAAEQLGIGGDMSNLAPEDVVAALIQAVMDDMLNSGADSYYTPEDLTQLLQLQQSLRQRGLGLYQAPDGTWITEDDYNNVLTDAERAAVDQFTAQQDVDRENAYRSALNEFNLGEEDRTRSRALDENSIRAQEFQDQISVNREALALNDADLNRAVQNVSRSLQGLQESRARSSQELDTLMAAAPYATTPGKTDFTARDIGTGAAGFLEAAGIGPDETFARFPAGTTRIDPRGTQQAYDESLGVAGPIPEIPEPLYPVSPPTAPSYLRPYGTTPDSLPEAEAAPRGPVGGTTTAPPTYLGPVRPGEVGASAAAAPSSRSYYEPVLTPQGWVDRGAQRAQQNLEQLSIERPPLSPVPAGGGGQNLGQIILNLLSSAGSGIGGTVAGRFR